MTSIRIWAVTTAAALAAAWAGCYTGDATGVVAPSNDAGLQDSATIVGLDDEAKKIYPTLAALYEGDRGIYRGCGPNNAVCHNGKEFPNLATLGSIVESIDAPCNQKRNKPLEIHDMCERPGDVLVIGDATPRRVEIGWIRNDDESDAGDGSRRWTVFVKDGVGAIDGLGLTIVRPGVAGAEDVLITYLVGTITADGAGTTLTVRLPDPPPPDPDGGAPQDDGAYVASVLAKAGVPGDPTSIQLGDANRNGTWGATIGARLIKPGAPDKSYLFSRLVDDKAGPLMPRANCCYWTKTSLRALWCWVAGLKSDKTNALDGIDYDHCPDGPADSVAYPLPGPQCETAQAGMCPVQPKQGLTEDATWANLYPHLFKQSCASCHTGGANAPKGLDMSTEQAAYDGLVTGPSPRVKKGDADHSKLYVSISPDACKLDATCVQMPFREAPLDDRARKLVKKWIDDGAAR